jgi:hypothetical protein
MREITKQDVTILQAYSSEFGKLPAKMKKYQKAMETTERLLNEFVQTEYNASIFLDDQVTPALESASRKLRDFSKSSYKVSVSVDMRKVYRVGKRKGDSVRRIRNFVQQVQESML